MTSEEPIFAPPIAGPVASRTRSFGCGCVGGALTLLALAIVALAVVLDGCAGTASGMVSQLIGCCGVNYSQPGPSSYPSPASGTPSTGGASTPSGGTPSVGSAPSQSAARVFANALRSLYTFEILISWGSDRAAENTRRLEWIAQSIREYQQVHGHPPASLSDLRVAPSDLSDVFGSPVDYRVVGGQWEIRSAGRDGNFDLNDPWLTGP